MLNCFLFVFLNNNNNEILALNLSIISCLFLWPYGTDSHPPSHSLWLGVRVKALCGNDVLTLDIRGVGIVHLSPSSYLMPLDISQMGPIRL